MNKRNFVLLMIGASLLTACGKKAEERKAGQVATPVTVAQADTRTIELLDNTVGSLESLQDPVLSAEVQGKVLQVWVVAGSAVKRGQVLAVLDAQDSGLARQVAQAEVARLSILQQNQNKSLERQRQLHEKNFISQAALDNDTAQASALNDQLTAARAQLALAERNVGKSNVVSPMDGRVEKQMASPGQFVKVGDPLFQVVTTQSLRARLPFPEDMAAVVKHGMSVRLTSPASASKVQSHIDEIRPMAGGSRSFDAFVTFTNPGTWQPGATVSAELVLGEHPNAVTVPAQSLVLRPAGDVVYVTQGDKAVQRLVEVGARQADIVEVTHGLKPGESVVVEGAAFLTDQAPISIVPAKPAAAH